MYVDSELSGLHSLVWTFTNHRTSFFRHSSYSMQLTSHVQFLLPRITHFFLQQHFFLFLTESSDCTKVLLVKYLSSSETTPLKPLIHFSVVRLGKRLVSQQIQVNMHSKHCTSHCTPSPPRGVQSAPASPGCTHQWLSIHT